MTTLTIRLPEELKNELDEISRDEKRAVSDIVRESIRRYIAIEKFREFACGRRFLIMWKR